MPDILLIQPPIEDFYITTKRTMPYGLASIAAALRQAGFSVALVDALATAKNRTKPWPDEIAFLHPFFGRSDRSPFALFHHWRHFGYSFEHIARLAKSAGAWLIGISSLFTAYADMALETAAAVKKACPWASVVLGGHHPSIQPEAVMRHPAVDFVLRGDGEVGLPLLARALRAGATLDRIPGLVRRDPRGILRQFPSAPVDLNRLPMPAFDLIDWRFYRRAGKAAPAISAGRGCPQRCTYCAVNAATGHVYRCRSITAVMAELEEIDRSSQLGFIDFEDEHLSADRAWFMDLLDAMGRRFAGRGVELRAMNGLFAPSLDEEMIECMRQAGFKTLNLALITTSAIQLKRFNRPDLSADIDRVVHLAGRSGLDIVAYLMVAGPGQDPVASVTDLLYLAQRRILAGVSVFYPAPGSADYRWCERRGLLPPRPGLMRATTLPLVHTTDRVQAVTLLRLGRLLNFMKHLLDKGIGWPVPDRPPAAIPLQVDRDTLGRILLAAFLKDGLIYGVDNDDGRVYPHCIDADLSRRFLAGLGKIRVRGMVNDE
jgi:anaerobic magnesium-protoporphyrin IX monomethyl ester cyclase